MMRQLDLAIEGMKCEGCAGTVHEALANIDGVEAVDVRLEEKRARVTVAESTEDAALIGAVVAAGYEASVL